MITASNMSEVITQVPEKWSEIVITQMLDTIKKKMMAHKVAKRCVINNNAATTCAQPIKFQ